MDNPFETILSRIDGMENLLKQSLLKEGAGSEPDVEIIDGATLRKRLGISEATEIRYRSKGALPYLSIGSSIRYNWQKVLQALEHKRKGK